MYRRRSDTSPAPPTLETTTGHQVTPPGRESRLTQGASIPVRSLTARSHDLSTRAGLGAVAGRLLDELSHESATVAELATRTGYRRRTVQRHLRVLQEHRLATHASGLPGAPQCGLWHSRATPKALAAATLLLDVAGTVQRRMSAYDVERRTYRWWLAALQHRRARRTPTARWVNGPRRRYPPATARGSAWRTALDLTRRGRGLRSEELQRQAADGTLVVPARTTPESRAKKPQRR